MKDCDIKKPPKSIPEPIVPSLQDETLLMKEGKGTWDWHCCLLTQACPEDLNSLQAFWDIKAKIDEFEGANEAKEGEQKIEQQLLLQLQKYVDIHKKHHFYVTLIWLVSCFFYIL